MTCNVCNGNYQNSHPEDICDYLPQDIWAGLTFKVYRQDRPITGNESLLGLGCVFSVTDYGEAFKNKDDAKLIAEIKAHTSQQATKVAKDDGTMCDHVGIFVSTGGYSVRAVFNNPDEVKAVIATERDYNDYLTTGTAMANAGLNGTIGAIFKE